MKSNDFFFVWSTNGDERTRYIQEWAAMAVSLDFLSSSFRVAGTEIL
jgi:hypothetical protein